MRMGWVMGWGVVFVLATAARGDDPLTWGIPSIELRVRQSSLIVLAHLPKQLPDQFPATLTFTVEEVLKGGADAPKTVSVRLDHGFDWEPDDDVVLFFRPDAEPDFVFLRGEYCLGLAIRRDGHSLSRREEVLAILRKETAKKGGETETLLLFNSSTRRYRERGLKYPLRVPVDDETHEMLAQWARSGPLEDRIEALSAFSTIGDARCIEMLREMLGDSLTQQLEDRISYPVRKQAYVALRKLKQEAALPLLESPGWAGRYDRDYPWVMRGALAVLAIPLVIFGLRRVRQWRGRAVERVGVRRILLGVFAIVGVFVCVLTVWAWMISRANVWNCTWRDGNGTDVQARFYFGQVQFWNDHRAVVGGIDCIPSFETSRDPARTFENIGLFGDSTSFLGFKWWHGFTIDGHEKSAFSFPLICLLLVFGPAPLWWMYRQAWYARRRWRGDRGRCVGCGYDLSHSPAGCPECGLGRG